MAESKPFTCPQCGGRLAYEAWEPVHYSLDPATGVIGAAGRRQGECLESEPALVCKDQKCGWVLVDDIETDLQQRKVTAFKP